MVDDNDNTNLTTTQELDIIKELLTNPINIPEGSISLLALANILKELEQK